MTKRAGPRSPWRHLIVVALLILAAIIAIEHASAPRWPKEGDAVATVLEEFGAPYHDSRRDPGEHDGAYHLDFYVDLGVIWKVYGCLSVSAKDDRVVGFRFSSR
jgi:hypothetical protein